MWHALLHHALNGNGRFIPPYVAPRTFDLGRVSVGPRGTTVAVSSSTADVPARRNRVTIK